MSKPEDQKQALVPAKSTLPANRDQALAMLEDAETDDHFEAGDRLVPWLKIVQGTSAVKKSLHDSYVKGAEVGMIYDTLTREMRDEVLIAIVKFDGQHYAEFEPNGGKLVKQWFKDASRYEASQWKDPEKPVGKKITPDGNEIAPSSLFYILVLDPETGEATPMIWSLGGMNQKQARRINSLAKAPLVINGKAKSPAMYSRTFRVTTRLKAVGDAGTEVGFWNVEQQGLITDHPEFGASWLELAKLVRTEADAGRLQPAEPMDADAADMNDSAAEADAANYEREQTGRKAQQRSKVIDVTDLNEKDKIPF